MDINKVIIDPCKDCENKQVDYYGYLCNLACGKYSACISELNGAKKMLEYLSKRNLSTQEAREVINEAH